MFYAKEVEQIEFFAVQRVVVVGKGQKYLGIEDRLDSKGQIHDSSKMSNAAWFEKSRILSWGFRWNCNLPPKHAAVEKIIATNAVHFVD